MQNPQVRRIAIYAGVLLGVFLLGLVPMWLNARELTKERDTAQAAFARQPFAERPGKRRARRPARRLRTGAADGKRFFHKPARRN